MFFFLLLDCDVQLTVINYTKHRIALLNFFAHHILSHLHSPSNSVNFKKNEKVYNPEKSEVLKALQESDNEPEPGNDDESALFEVVDDDNQRVDHRVMISNDDDFEKYSHFYELAFILSHLNDEKNIFTNDKLID